MKVERWGELSRYTVTITGPERLRDLVNAIDAGEILDLLYQLRPIEGGIRVQKAVRPGRRPKK